MLLSLASLAACGRGPSEQQRAEPSAAPLADVDVRYRHLLRREMTMIEDATRRLASHLARGEARLAASAAASIRDRRVMERSLSPAERRQLEGQLPAELVELDARFRSTAAGLSSAAAAGDLEHAARLYSGLLEGCIACHSRYASGRFPGFTQRLGGPETSEEATP